MSGVPGPAGRRWTGEDDGGTGRGGVRARATPAAARGLAPGRAGPAPNGRGVSGALARPCGPIGWPGGANLNLATTMYARDHAERGAARAALLPTGEPFARRPCRIGACLGRGSGSGVLGWGGGARGPPGDLTLSLVRASPEPVPPPQRGRVGTELTVCSRPPPLRGRDRPRSGQGEGKVRRRLPHPSKCRPHSWPRTTSMNAAPNSRSLVLPTPLTSANSPCDVGRRWAMSSSVRSAKMT